MEYNEARVRDNQRDCNAAVDCELCRRILAMKMPELRLTKFLERSVLAK